MLRSDDWKGLNHPVGHARWNQKRWARRNCISSCMELQKQEACDESFRLKRKRVNRAYMCARLLVRLYVCQRVAFFMTFPVPNFGGLPILGGLPIFGVSHFWGLPFWGSPILGVSHFGGLPFWGSPILGVSHFGGLPFWGSPILGVSHFGGLPFWDDDAPFIVPRPAAAFADGHANRCWSQSQRRPLHNQSRTVKLAPVVFQRPLRCPRHDRW